MRNKTSVTFVAAALALLVGNAAAVPYTFTNITDSDFANPVLNNSGTVAFLLFLDTGVQEGIFTGSGGPTTTIINSSGPFAGSAGSFLSLNDSGTVAFLGEQDSGERGIFTGSGGPITTIADSSGPINGFGTEFSLNESGTVAFTNSEETGIFTGNGGTITTIADTSGPFSRVVAPSLNNSGMVAFKGFLNTGEEGIFTGSGGPITTIVDGSGPFVAFNNFTSPSLNDSGTVAFIADLNTGERGIFSGSGGAITTVLDNRGPFDNFGVITLNDGGMIAFSAVLDNGEAGIFTGRDPLADKVIGIGDPLFGSTLESINMFREWLNDTGQIAFTYILADGRIGILRADPLVTPVPEPGTLILLFAGLLGAVLWFKGKST